MMRALAASAAGIIIFASGVWAQAQGRIVGTVSDQEGAVVQGAAVTLVNEGMQFSRAIVTNENGAYVAEAFPTGRITVTVQHPGFQKLVRSGIELTAADTITVDLKLQVGNVQETVQVQAEASLVQTQNATVSSLINHQQVQEMPLNERSFTNLLQLTAGASPSTPGMAAGLTGYSMRASNAISINGATANNSAYLIDGLYNRQLWVNGLIMNPPVDAIQETRIMATDYSAQYGNSAGGVTVVLTRSGSNEMHGSLYEFLRNSDLDANTFFGNRAGIPKAAFRRNEFGGTFGAPIRRDKTFVFGDYQGIRVIQPPAGGQVDSIPTLAQQQMVESGDFSQLGSTVYNPFQTVAGANGVVTRVPFAGNQIPLGMLDPAAVKTMTLLPVPTNLAKSNNFTFNPIGRQRDDQYDIRVDQNMGKTDRMFFKYSYDNTTGTGAGTLPVGPNPNKIDIGQYLTGGGPSYQRNWSATANYTKVISPSVVNEGHLGVVRNWLSIYNDDTPHNTAASLGIPNINISDTNGGIPNMVIGGFSTQIGNSNSFPEFTRSVSIPFEDILTIVKGSHTIKVGGGFTRHRFDGHTSVAPRGQYSFSGAFTRQINGTGSATALADFALGAAQSISRSEQFGQFGLRMWDASAFAEDAWRVTSRFTLTYGLRYELQAPPKEVYNRWANMNVVTGRFAVAGTQSQNECGPALICLDKKDFAPRIGIAQILTKDEKTVLRAGFGASYFEANNGGRMLHSNPPMNIIQSFAFDQNGTPGTLLSQGLPLPVEPNLQDPTQLTGQYTAFDPHMKLNRSLQFHVGIQRELKGNVLVEVGYVRTVTNHMTNSIIANQAAPGPGPLNPRRPLYLLNPILGDIDYRTNYGMGKYNSMQTKLTKRYSKGLTAAFAWTWSHNIANTMGANSSTRPQDSRCSACEWGNLPEDRRHMVVINHVYELPFGTGRQFAGKGWLSYIIGNWDISGIWTMYSGTHFGPTLSSSVSNSIGSAALAPAERPNVVGSPNLPVSQRTISAWFNTAAFQSPAQYTFGNSGTGVLVGPGYFNTDLGIHRNFSLAERAKLSFRWEMFNSFNRANFSNPNASIGGSSAGVISNTLAARVMQVAMKLTF
jgi:hypothetical protein